MYSSTVLSIQTEKAGIPSSHEHSQHTKAQKREKYLKVASNPCSKIHQCECLRWREWGVSVSWGFHWSLKLRDFLKPTAHTVAHAFIRSSPNERRYLTMDLNRCHRLKNKAFPFRHQVSAIEEKPFYFDKAAATSPQVTQQNFHCINDIFKDMSQDLNKSWNRTAQNVFVFKHEMNCILLLGTQCLIRLCVIMHGNECLILFRDYSNYSKKHLWYV